MNWNVLKSIFKRDFVSYFSSPTGYVFICVFVVLSSLATFWPPEFFTTNLANLDQLSRWLPFIMLVFIPAITMSTWAEERRQGTDELLLTVPASDFDVVLGKYLAGVAIFTVSLLFSAFSIFLVFKWGLGDPDVGLFLGTYIGYWFIGIAMIAIGMVASFLTDNLTVGFILGMLFNLPLAAAGVADWFIKDPAFAQAVRRWSALEQFRDFERGVLSLGGITYFVAIAAVMIYLSMILISRRHWSSSEEGDLLPFHYLVRTIALLCVAVGVTQFVQDRNWLRADISSEQLSSLSEDTLEILEEIRNDDSVQTINIDAYVSPQVPTEYAATKHNFLSTLTELQALSGNKIQVTKHEIENYGPEAVLAERTYGITPQEVMIVTGRERSEEEFFLGAAITSGLGKVVIPFIDKGIPVEYELVRSIATVIQQENLKVGIIDTGIPYLNPSSNREQEWPLISELRKQYDIDDRAIDPSQPITGKYDVLLAVQPSMLGPQEMDHLVDAVRKGTPIAILEDPFPYAFPQDVAGTAEQRMPPGMGMFGGGGPMPKGDIQQLWDVLGVDVEPTEVVWQDYSPEASLGMVQDDQWVFIDEGNGARHPLSPDSIITSGMNQLLFIYPGAVSKAEESELRFEPLVVTGDDNSGTVMTQALQRQAQNEGFIGRTSTNNAYILAAHVRGEFDEDQLLLESTTLEEAMRQAEEAEADSEEESADSAVEQSDSEEPPPAPDSEAAEGETEEAESAGSGENAPEAEVAENLVNAVVVADIDWILPVFFGLRESGESEFLPATQNVTFILNIIDALAGDERFISIRKRAREHRTLSKIDEATEIYRHRAREAQLEGEQELEEQLAEAQKAFDEKIAAVQAQEGLSRMAREQQIEVVRQREQARLRAEQEAIQTRQQRRMKQIRYEMEQNVRSVQDMYKMFAIVIPPIPPLLVALYVYFRRREAEREGITKERLK